VKPQKEAASEALRTSEEQYQSILRNIEDGYYEINLRGDFIFFNDAMCRILGYSRKEMTRMNYRRFTDKENAEKIFQTFNNVYQTGNPSKGFDWKIIRKNGTERFVEASLSLQKDSSCKPAGFLGIIRDVTERRQAEDALRQSEERYRTFVENASDVVFRTDVNGYFTFANPAMLRITGYSEKEFIGKHYRVLVRQDKYGEVMKLLVGQYKSRIPNTYQEFPIVQKDGQENGLAKIRSCFLKRASRVAFRQWPVISPRTSWPKKKFNTWPHTTH